MKALIIITVIFTCLYKDSVNNALDSAFSLVNMMAAKKTQIKPI